MTGVFKSKAPSQNDRPWAGCTSLSKAMASDRRMLDRLAAAYPILTRFQDRVVREAVSDTVTLADLAQAAAVPIEELLRVAKGGAASDGPWPSPELEPQPVWMAGLDVGNLERLDVRPDMVGRRDPFARVMELAASIAEGGAFVLDTLFEPAPLRRVLGKQGFASYAKKLRDEHWQAVFLRQGGTAAVPAGQARLWREDGIDHIDVRGLEPPQPMVSILAFLERSEAAAVIVHHEREPVFLYPELTERGWNWELIDGAPGEIRLRLTRSQGAA